jgi:serralysin
MALQLVGALGARSAIDPRSLKVAASRAQASPLSGNVRLSLGTPAGTHSGMACSCLQCGASVAGGTARAGVVRSGAPVDYTDTIKKRGRITTDALLAGGNRWFHTLGASGEIPSAVAKKTISFSFIESAAGLNGTDANGFAALNTTQRDRIRDAFGYLSELIDVQFTEVGSGGDIQFGSNAQANSAGYARYPNEGSQVFMANNQAGFASDWGDGSYVWQTLLHETAHALGLKHPGNYNAGGGGTAGPYLSAAADNRNNTIMSYKNASNMTRIAYDNGSFSKSVVNASTFQAYDIEALQYLYGESSTVTAKAYSWEAGLAFSNTLWNPNEGSEINLANQTGLNVVDLRAGKRSSIGIVDPYADMPYTKAGYAALKSGGSPLTAILGRPTYTGVNNLMIAAGSQFTRGIGGSGSDSFVANTIGGHLDGGGGDDNLYWTGGNLQAVGGEGNDTLLLKKVAGATWTVNAEGTEAVLRRTDPRTQVVTTLSTVSLSGIESVRYWNGTTLKPTSAAALYAAAASPAAATTRSVA